MHFSELLPSVTAPAGIPFAAISAFHLMSPGANQLAQASSNAMNNLFLATKNTRSHNKDEVIVASLFVNFRVFRGH